MIEITSSSNDRVRRVQALQRSTRRRLREGLMVVEGMRLVEELIASSFPVIDLFLTQNFVTNDETREVVEQACDDDRCALVPEDLMQAMSDTMTPQGILAVTTIPDLQVTSRATFTLIPDQVRDPGNVGTMLRTAWAAGVEQILIPPGTVDPTNPKVVRAGMGAHFHVPCQKLDWTSIWHQVGEDQILLAEAGEGITYDRVDWRKPTTLVVGGEAFGAGAETRARAECVRIPMATGVESLNAAIAGAIMLFEAARQRETGRS
jgi:RNA methyltransferase, TrmH family